MNETAPQTNEIDVRDLIPIKRHELLLKMFGALPVDESFVFINDHDPIPLFYEFQSIYGDVVGWEYLNRGGRDWKVKVTRTDESAGREFVDVSTVMDLRKVEKSKWKHVVFHRFSMMQKDDIMELLAAQEPAEIKDVFESSFAGEFEWERKREEPGEIVIHIKKTIEEAPDGANEVGFAVVYEFDVRPFPPALRHDMFYQAFNEIYAGEAFVFTNDHDPRPLYYQLEAESEQPFKWEYLEEGPEVWKVRVIKLKGTRKV